NIWLDLNGKYHIIADKHCFTMSTFVWIGTNASDRKLVPVSNTPGNYAFDGQGFREIRPDTPVSVTLTGRPCFRATNPTDYGKAVILPDGNALQLGTGNGCAYCMKTDRNFTNPLPVVENSNFELPSGAEPLPSGWLRVYDTRHRQYYYIDPSTDSLTLQRPTNASLSVSNPAQGTHATETPHKIENKFHRDLSAFPIREVSKTGKADPVCARGGRRIFTDRDAIAYDTRESAALTLSAASMTTASSLSSSLKIKDRAYKFFECIRDYVNETPIILDQFFDELIGANIKILPGHSPGSLCGEVRDFSECKTKRELCLAQLNYMLELIPESFNGKCPAAEEMRTSQILQRFAWFSNVIGPHRQEPWIQPLAQRMNTIKTEVWGNNDIFQMRGALYGDMLRHEFNLATAERALTMQIGACLQQENVPKQHIDWICYAANLKMARTSSATLAAYRSRQGGGLGKTQLKDDDSSSIHTQFLDRAVDRSGSRTDICQSRCSDISRNIPTAMASIIGERGETIDNFMRSLEDQKVCENDETGDVFPSYGELPIAIVDVINDPISFLRSAIKECPNFPPVVAQAFEQFEQIHHSAMQQKLQEQLLDTHFLDNGGEELSIGKMVQRNATGTRYEARPTSGEVIRSTGLQTVMSTSGTTRDILAAYHSLFGLQKMGEIFSSLVNFVNNGCDFSQSPLHDDFKKIFAQTVLQFKAGNFHSPGEILTALYFSTLKMFPNLKPQRRKFASEQDYIAAVHQNLEKLLIAFRDHPEEFYPMDEESKTLFNANIDQVIRTVQDQHTANIKKRLAPNESYHKATAASPKKLFEDLASPQRVYHEV
ncbi:MAG: hypothetical protein LBG98_02220, partial [Puniceicoccales bacterium]|nr:hypothetical protein [Puniceicoccales bacterium]